MGKQAHLSLRMLACAATSAFVAFGACSDSKTPSSSSPGGGTGATSGWTFVPPGSDVVSTSTSGGAGGGAAGSGAAAGTGGGANTAGSGGSSVVLTPYACSGKVPSQAVITHFDGFMKDRWKSPGNLDGGIYIYPDPLMVKDGDFLRFDDSVATWTGIGVWFSGCINASKYAGVKFTIYGATPQAVWMYAISNRNRDIDDDNAVGACAPADPLDAWATCRPPGLTVTVTAEPTTKYVPWSAFEDGMPSDKIDGSDLLALQWSFDWNENMKPYAAKLTIDDLELVLPGNEPTGGTGGSGGTGSGGGGGRGGSGGTGAGSGGVPLGGAPDNEAGAGGI